MLTLSEIAARDLDITIVRQLPLADLSLGNAFEPSAIVFIQNAEALDPAPTSLP